MIAPESPLATDPSAYLTFDTGAPYDETAQVHLGVFYPAIGPQYRWADSALHFTADTTIRTAQTLERGLFDALFVGDGQRVREHRGRVYELDISGRPDAITLMGAVASITERIGLVVTQNATYNLPADLIRRLSSLDHLSGGRAGWNVVTTDNAWTGANFRHPAWLPHERRYERATALVEAANAYWSTPLGGVVERHSDLLDIAVEVSEPASPQGRPVIFQAGDSEGGRELAARYADAIFSANLEYPRAAAYAADLRARLRRHGRDVNAVRILPGATVVLGDTPAEAEEKARELQEWVMSPSRAIAFFEQYWGCDLSAYDPDGPLPDIDPVEGELSPERGTIAIEKRSGKLAQIEAWRRESQERGLSILQLAREVNTAGARSFVGTPAQLADRWGHYVRTRAVDGFNISPYSLPGNVDDIVDKLVPALQERGLYRDKYEGTTLRDHLGLSPRRETTA